MTLMNLVKPGTRKDGLYGTVEEVNKVFFEGLRRVQRQRKAAGDDHVVFGDQDGLKFALVNWWWGETGHGELHIYSRHPVEMVIRIPGHEYKMPPEWVDSLHKWLSKVIAARPEPKSKQP